MVEFLYLPLEMICEVVKFVDNNGLLALRKVNRITRDAVDNVCRSMQIQNIYVYDFGGEKVRVDVTIDHRGSAISFLPCFENLRQYSDYQKQVFVICPTEDFPEAMKALHGAIKRCPIDNFTFNCKYKNEAVITITDRFLDGLNVKKERCLYACDFSKDESDLAISFIKRLNMNKIVLSHADKFPLEETFKMADLVDSILIHHTPTSFDTVSFAMTIFALRYTSLEFYYSAVSMRGVLKFAEELPKLRKKVYFKARIREDRNDAFSISDVNRALGFHAFLLNGFTDPVNGYIEISDGNITVDGDYIYKYAHL